MKLNKDFYNRPVLSVSRDLLGKRLFSYIDGQLVSGIICETEAYAGVNDKASHAYGNRRTKRTESMYRAAGLANIYLCYGIHHLFNVVVNHAEIPEAVLIRGISIDRGISTALKRRNKSTFSTNICIGPGKVSQALGINTKDNLTSLLGDKIWIEDVNIQPKMSEIISSPRIGVDYAEEDALLPYRFQYKVSNNLI